MIINAFALTGRIVFGGFLPQGVALGYVLLPLRGVLLKLLTYPPPIVFQKDSFCMLKGLHLQSESKVI